VSWRSEGSEGRPSSSRDRGSGDLDHMRYPYGTTINLNKYGKVSSYGHLYHIRRLERHTRMTNGGIVMPSVSREANIWSMATK
jgi:hypothetical protein